MGRIDTASELCTLVFSGNLPLLKRYLQAGIEVWRRGGTAETLSA